MRRVGETTLWIGHVGDARDLRRVLAEGVEAIVDLEIMEPPLARLTRELIYCRYPLLDGAGNSEWRLRGALDCVAHLLAAHVPTLIFCGFGMSRSPCIAAGALTLAGHGSLEDSLALVLGSGPADISPGLLAEVREMVGVMA